MKQRFESSSESLLNSKITEILIEDACGQVMPKANADYFGTPLMWRALTRQTWMPAASKMS